MGGSKKAYSYIRMSTEIQLKGDSLNRQLRLSEAYAAQHGLELVQEYQDLGVSAYASDNLISGSLGRFVEAVREGKVPSDAYLLVESLDRISRDNPLAALNTFQDILRLGITIVTLSDGQIYSQATIATEPMRLLMSMMYMVRAHDESKMKSGRIAAAWEAKRQNIGVRKLTGLCPHWLKLSEDSTYFEVIEGRAQLVRDIFQWTIDGYGVEAVTKRLNQEGPPCWGRTNGWRASYIKKILVNRAVLGELALHKVINGKREPIAAQSDYYPAIVPVEQFYSAQKARAVRTGKGGRKGVQVSNLFSGIVKCGYCGGPACLKDRGAARGKFLVCDRAQRGMGCTGTGFPYLHLEHTFFGVAHEVELRTLLAPEDTQDELATISTLLNKLNAEQLDLQARQSTLLKSLEEAGAGTPRTAVKRLAELEGLQDELVERIQKLDNQRQILQSAPDRIQLSLNETQALIEQLKNTPDESKTELRLRLQQRIRAVIKQIDLYPKGQAPLREEKLKKLATFLDEHEPDTSLKHALIQHLGNINSSEDRQYIIHFHSGRYCVMTVSSNSTESLKWTWKFDTHCLIDAP